MLKINLDCMGVLIITTGTNLFPAVETSLSWYLLGSNGLVQGWLPLDDNKLKKKSINTQEISLSNHVQNFFQPAMDVIVAPITTQNGQEQSKVVSTLRKPSKGGWNSAIFIICKLTTSSSSFYFLWNKNSSSFNAVLKS